MNRLSALKLCSVALSFSIPLAPRWSRAESIDKATTMRKKHDDLVLVSGTANIPLAKDVANILEKSLSDVDIRRFSDGEISCSYNDSIRGKSVFIIQTCGTPVNDNIMELLLLVSAARRAGGNSKILNCYHIKLPMCLV
jgi:hypothetical protein